MDCWSCCSTLARIVSRTGSGFGPYHSRNISKENLREPGKKNCFRNQMVITNTVTIYPIAEIYVLRIRSRSHRTGPDHTGTCFQSNRQKHRGKEHDLVLPCTVSTVPYSTVPVQEIGTVLNTINQKVRKVLEEIGTT
jgi:hypothetical protein